MPWNIVNQGGHVLDGEAEAEVDVIISLRPQQEFDAGVQGSAGGLPELVVVMAAACSCRMKPWPWPG